MVPRCAHTQYPHTTPDHPNTCHPPPSPHPHTQVLARSTPADKAQLVRLLKRAGHVVAVTGDGGNDVQAMREADVGLAMGGAGVCVRGCLRVCSCVLPWVVEVCAFLRVCVYMYFVVWVYLIVGGWVWVGVLSWVVRVMKGYQWACVYMVHICVAVVLPHP